MPCPAGKACRVYGARSRRLSVDVPGQIAESAIPMTAGLFYADWEVILSSKENYGLKFVENARHFGAPSLV